MENYEATPSVGHLVDQELFEVKAAKLVHKLLTPRKMLIKIMEVTSQLRSAVAE